MSRKGTVKHKTELEESNRIRTEYLQMQIYARDSIYTILKKRNVPLPSYSKEQPEIGLHFK